MSALAGPYAIAAVLLAGAGAAKAVRPDETVGALRKVLGRSVADVVVRLGGLGEVAVGTAALVAGGRVSAALVAVSYLAFAGFVVLALARHAPIGSCGCFGRAETPPTRIHVALDVAFAAVAATVAVAPFGAVVDVVADQPLGGVPFVTLVASGAACTALIWTRMARLLRLVEGGPA